MSDARPLELSPNIVTECAARPELDPDDQRAESLKKLADALLVEHAASHKIETIESAISVLEEVLQLRAIGHKRRAEAVGDLGHALFLVCYHHEVNDAQRARCLNLLREALLLHPPGHSARDQALHNLARALQFVGYQQQANSLDNLIEAIEMNREALQLRPVGHPERAKSLNNLAYGLMRSFEHCGDLDLLAEAITIQRDVVSLQPPGHPLRDTALSNLANALESSFQHQGGAEMLAEAISTSREALHLRPVGHPLRWIALSNLGNALGSSFASNGFPDMLSESICVQREAVQLGPSTHPEYGVVLNNLAERLIASFRYHRDYAALADAITLLQQSLGLLAEGNRYLDGLNDLAEALIASYDVHKDFERLNDAIRLHREALESRPPGHFRRMESLQGLGRLLCRAECRSWTEAVILLREALEICPTGSTHRAEVLSDVSMCSLDPDSPFFNLPQGVADLSEAYSDNFCHVNRRLRSALTDLPRVEIAYTEAAAVLDSSVLEHHSNLVLELYAQVISLLPRAANFGLDHHTRLQAVTGLDVIVRDAAGRAVVLGREFQAVEMLEGGRGVFWGQALHLRTTAFDGVPQDDCRELQRLLTLLERSSRRVQRSYQSATQQELDLEKRRQHNEEAEALIVKIRSYAGLDRFLLPPTFNALVGALPDGFVAIVNASKLRQHALLLNRSIGLMASLELQPPPTGFNPTDLISHLPRDMGSGTLGGVTRAMRKSRGLGDSFMNILAMLWSSIVRPIITQLGLQKSTGRARPRLWWCVTGELGFLPIHAAGDYRDSIPVCAADYITSSYIPTLASLNKSRAGWNPIPLTQLAGLVVCEESPNSEHGRHLPEAAAEVCIVRERFDLANAQVLNLPSTHTTRATLRLLLEERPSHILHLACHGIHNSDPLRSALVLQDGNFTIQDIMDLRLPNAVLAVLSACQTAKGDRNAPDQAVHLAASMLFCGFRSVIGTMWLMHDEDGPKVARALYEALFLSDIFDLDAVPYALDEAIQSLRTAGVPAQRWALFMHMGG